MRIIIYKNVKANAELKSIVKNLKLKNEKFQHIIRILSSTTFYLYNFPKQFHFIIIGNNLRNIAIIPDSNLDAAPVFGFAYCQTKYFVFLFDKI